MNRFGACIPLFANPGRAFFRTPAWEALEPGRALDFAVNAEELGYDSVFVADHLMHGVDGGILEGWTTLSVIAGRTRRVALGTIHLAQPFRAPALVAKMAATLDALSGGRLIFFYDCGWQQAEVNAYGLPWPDEAERIARMDEGLTLIDRLWRAEEPLHFNGQFEHTVGAICRPKPVQRPRPPIWLGEARHDHWLDVIVRHADGWNSVPATLPDLRDKIEHLGLACERAGRDLSQLELSLETQVLVAPTESGVDAILSRIAALPASPRGAPKSIEALRQDSLVGTPATVVSRLRDYSALGISHFILWFLDFPSLTGLRLFAEQVLPAVREG
jgi:alkanesulfonate monooxygenase SsuD/methylene tetrahydromethanopterin reductase-like flavin-dependent oxidoreductase (luciferase family)